MTQLFANNAQSTLASSVNSSTTTLPLGAGTGASFPSPSGGDFFMLTLTQPGIESSWEIVKVTARSTDSLTVVRAQEGTSAASWASGSKAELRLTAGAKWSLTNIDESIAPTWTGSHRFNQAVGIGASNSSSTGSMLVVAGAQFNSLLVRSTGSSGGVGGSDIYLGSASGDLSGGIVGYDHGTNMLGLGAGGAVKVSINSSGAVRVGGSFGTAGQVMTSAGSSSPAVWGNLPAAANPTASVGLTAVNGSAGTFMRSDAAPALSQAISPTWTGNHTFAPASGNTVFSAGNVGIGVTPGAKLDVSTGSTNRLRVSEAGSDLYFDSLNAGATGWADCRSRATNFRWATAPSGTMPSLAFHITDTGNVRVTRDNGELQIGASQDLRIYHDGSDSIIENDTGNLVLKVNGELALSEVSTTTTAPSAGGAGALPATPAGYATFIINGATQKIPYY